MRAAQPKGPFRVVERGGEALNTRCTLPKPPEPSSQLVPSGRFWISISAMQHIEQRGRQEERAAVMVTAVQQTGGDAPARGRRRCVPCPARLQLPQLPQATPRASHHTPARLTLAHVRAKAMPPSLLHPDLPSPVPQGARPHPTPPTPPPPTLGRTVWPDLPVAAGRQAC